VIHTLRGKGYDVIGLFAGECRDPQYMEKIQKTIRQYGLEQSVAFLGRRNDIPDLLKLIDVLIIPSSFEGFPLAGLEAAAAGVPVATCNVAGAKEFIEVSGDGMCFPEGDIPEAVKAIERINTGKKEFATCGMNFVAGMSNADYMLKIRELFNKI